MAESCNNQRGRKRKSFLTKAKTFGKKGKFGRGHNISGDTYQYFLRVLQLAKEDFESIEDRAVFVNNVFDQTVGEEVNYSCNQLASQAIETLLPSASNEGLERFMMAFGKDLRPLCGDPFASHVLQKLLKTASGRVLQKEKNTVSDGEEDYRQKCERWVLKVGHFLVNNLEEFVWNMYANHVIRTVLECLSGVSVGETVLRSRKWNRGQPGKDASSAVSICSDDTVPETFRELLREFAQRLMSWPQFVELAYNDLTSGLIQVLMLSIRKPEPKLTHKLVKKLVADFREESNAAEVCDNSEGGESVSLLRVFESQPAMYVLDVALSVASPGMSSKIYKKCFRGRLQALSVHRVANFTVQKLFDFCIDKSEFEEMFDELAAGLDNVLSSGNTGVLFSLCRACERLGVKQGNFIQQLMKTFHCFEPEDRQIHFALFVSRMVFYDTYDSDKDNFHVHLHGSLLLQSMLAFNKPIKVVNSLLEMKPADLKSLFCDPKGCHVMDAFMTSSSVGEKSREKLIRKLQGNYVSMACSKHGSRSVDDIWKVANLKQKLLILDELAPKEPILNSSEFGHIVAEKYALSLYRHRKQDWKDFQSTEQKKRKLFADVIGDFKGLPSKSVKKKDL